MRVPLPAAKIIAAGGTGGASCSAIAVINQRLPPRAKSRRNWPTRIRTWTNRTKICCATVTPSAKTFGGRGTRASIKGSDSHRREHGLAVRALHLERREKQAAAGILTNTPEPGAEPSI